MVGNWPTCRCTQESSRGDAPPALAIPHGKLIDVTPYAATWPVLKKNGQLWFLADDTATLEKPPGYKIGIARPSRFFAVSDDAEAKEVVQTLRHAEFLDWSAGYLTVA